MIHPQWIISLQWSGGLAFCAHSSKREWELQLPLRRLRNLFILFDLRLHSTAARHYRCYALVRPTVSTDTKKVPHCRSPCDITDYFIRSTDSCKSHNNLHQQNIIFILPLLQAQQIQFDAKAKEEKRWSDVRARNESINDFVLHIVIHLNVKMSRCQDPMGSVRLVNGFYYFAAKYARRLRRLNIRKNFMA